MTQEPESNTAGTPGSADNWIETLTAIPIEQQKRPGRKWSDAERQHMQQVKRAYWQGKEHPMKGKTRQFTGTCLRCGRPLGKNSVQRKLHKNLYRRRYEY
jgi:hypothetical protein